MGKNRLGKDAIGVFKGFTEAGREFLVEVLAPYNPEFVPLLGSFVLVGVNDLQALLGRVTRFHPSGTMAGTEADEYLSRLQRLRRPVPEDVKEVGLRYSVQVRLLGTIELAGCQLRYRPGVRTLPHLGASVYSLTEDELKFVCNAHLEADATAVPIGCYSLGDREFHDIEVKFSFSRLVSKRTFVFARAGYGKSNLIKLLVSRLYEQESKVGMLIFDPEGEYSFRDAQGRPGLADVPEISERLVVFTDRKPPDSSYEPFIAGSVRLNLSQIHSSWVVDICLPEEKQERDYSNLLRGLSQEEWTELVMLFHEKGYRTSKEDLEKALDKLSNGKTSSAIVRNLVPVVRRLHDERAQLPSSLIYYLSQGCIVVVDISLLPSRVGQEITGLILKTVFEHNVNYFTGRDQDAVIRVVAVIEEAQNVLSAEKMQESSPFVEWAKEGRKYGLGTILVTQQPGSISGQLLSQGDNFFALHLLSHADLDALQRNNAHFSDDILSYILNEPIEGNVYFWSAPSQPYVISARIFSFEDYVGEKQAQSASGLKQTAGSAVSRYCQLKEKLLELAWKILASDHRVPVYEPVRGGVVVQSYGAVNKFNLSRRMAERLSEVDASLALWTLPGFFERTRNGQFLLEGSFLSELGQSVKGTRDGSPADYLLIPLGKISFSGGKAQDKRRVEISDEAGEKQKKAGQAGPREALSAVDDEGGGAC